MYRRANILCFGLLYMVCGINGHGLLLDPPSRVSAWRFGFCTPYESTDNQWNCGGFGLQKELGGKCGVCGDPWNQTPPRQSEPGGKFAKNVTIVKTYAVGQIIEVTVKITANHLGYVEFKLCPVTDPSIAVTPECLDQNRLPISDGSGYEFDITTVLGTTGTGEIKVKLQLPENFACGHCVLQWRYWTANSWGVCEDGSGGKLGCGPQEEFRACADISIVNEGVVIPPPIVGNCPPSIKVTTTPAGNGGGQITNGDCSTSPTGYIRDTNDCSRFYRCIPAVGGGWNKVPFSCPAGLVWNTAITACDYSYNVAEC